MILLVCCPISYFLLHNAVFSTNMFFFFLPVAVGFEACLYLFRIESSFSVDFLASMSVMYIEKLAECNL